MPEIKVIIDKKTGKMEVDAVGYSGKGCSHDLDAVLRQVGARTLTRKRKQEYNKVKKSIKTRR